MPDRSFAEPRLAQIYDGLEPDRTDLGHYLSIAEELDAGVVLDVGCGTGTYATLLAARGLEVVAVDPAAASLQVAKRKWHADRVRWHLGDAASVPACRADLATMTGNVAQVFLTDADWLEALAAIRLALRPGGHLVFEVRDPAKRAWEGWNRDSSLRRLELPGAGFVESWVELTDVRFPMVSFRWTYRFESDGALLTSDSTLRFRDRAEVEVTLSDSGFEVLEVRDAPDRPGLEFVFVARLID